MQRQQLDELMQSLSRSRDENLVVDIESALRLAQQQAQLTGSAEPLLAALRTAELPADFLSLGTNDLTQLVLGLSRDDAEARLLGPYRAAGITTVSPFESLDPAVIELVRLTVRRAGGRAVGICGEQAADPASLEACRDAGVVTVSCSPFRVPVARLLAGRAAATEVLGAG